MPKSDKMDIRNAKRTANAMQKKGLRLSNSAATENNKRMKEDLKSGKSKVQVKVKSSGMKVTKTNSARKTGVANKLKTQGKPAMQSGKGYMRTGKK